MGSQQPRCFDVHRIAIIGAGPCGLAAAKYLLAQNTFENVNIFEQQAEVGGVWYYSPKPSDTLHVPSLTPLCPPDPPLAEDTLIFPSREDIQDYVVEYSKDIRHLIQFSTRVEDVRLRQVDGKDQWDVDTLCLRTGKKTSATYDAVVVSSGQYTAVYIPDAKNIEQFHKAHPGAISHSKHYRNPEPFTNKKVVVVGNAASGLDIAAQISPVCKKPLLLSVRTPTPPAHLAYSGAEEVPVIEEFLVEERGIRFADGRVEKDIDFVIYATGYLFAFPFLQSLKPPVMTDGRRVPGLYQHLFHIEHPTMVFTRLPFKVVPFPLSESQAAVFSRVWANLLPLPPAEEMRKWEEEEMERQGSKYHVWVDGRDSKYINSVHAWIKGSGTPGKEPPYWSPELVWQRTIYGKAKLAFELTGRKARSLEELVQHFATPINRAKNPQHNILGTLPSQIKQAYRFFQIPGILNIAGGLPNVALFPFDTLEAQTAKPERWTPTPNHPGETAASASSSDPAAANHITVPKILDEKDLLKKVDLSTALQYGLSQGYPPLLSWVRQFTRENLHPETPYRDGPEVILTCGSTDGFSKVLNLFVNQWNEGVSDIRERPGMLCETFVYSNVLSQAQPLGVQVAPVKADAKGMAVKGPGGLEDVLANWDPSKGKRPHLMYTVTLGHNPTGIVLSVERRKEIYAVCSKYDVIIVEDEPYWYLQFPSAAPEEAKSRDLPSPPHPNLHSQPALLRPSLLDSLVPSFISLDTDGRVVRLDTFSKTVAPGCRLGWITAQPSLIERFQRINEATTQQPSGFVQSLISELVLGPPSSSAPETQQNTLARAAFSLLRTPSSQQSFTGWSTTGWIRWLAGLRGTYERRMARMCRILDSGSTLLTTTPHPSPPIIPSRNGPPDHHQNKLVLLLLPRGMFIWPFRVIEGWRYVRMCFAAEGEKEVDEAARRFVEE
ncbi:hypothetical protein N0V88_002390 [Collariella sp. IMI 366227]|nr:hypothetical protein N0V88_002390 [Collariella sp. IMI 366227]